jgi:hypothetical protein
MSELDILEQIQDLWGKLDRKQRNQHLDWTLTHCATCGEAGAENGMWCDACCETIDVARLYCVDCCCELTEEELDADRGQCFSCFCLEQSV